MFLGVGMNLACVFVCGDIIMQDETGFERSARFLSGGFSTEQLRRQGGKSVRKLNAQIRLRNIDVSVAKGFPAREGGSVWHLVGIRISTIGEKFLPPDETSIHSDRW